MLKGCVVNRAGQFMEEWPEFPQQMSPSVLAQNSRMLFSTEEVSLKKMVLKLVFCRRIALLKQTLD